MIEFDPDVRGGDGFDIARDVLDFAGQLGVVGVDSNLRAQAHGNSGKVTLGNKYVDVRVRGVGE